MMTCFLCFLFITWLHHVRLVSAYRRLLGKEGVFTNSKEDLKPRIVFGENAKNAEFPSIVYIKYYDYSVNLERICGGSIVSHRHVLTASSCCKWLTAGNSSVRVGENNLNIEPDCDFEILNLTGFFCDYDSKDIKVDKITLPPSYNSSVFPGNLCIIRLTEDITFKKHIDKIPLPFDGGVDLSRESFDSLEMTVAGWGRLRQGGDPSFLLMTALVYGLGIEACKNRWKGFDMGINGDLVICAGGFTQSNICEGDIGGPLMYWYRGKTYLVGVAVAAGACLAGNPDDRPGVFVRVDRYKDWIMANIQ